MSDTRFMSSFMLLALVSGLTVGLGKVVTTLYAIELGATPFQIGIVSAMESAGMILVTVPAGFIIARYGARPIYFASSFGPLLINLALPFAGGWAGLALGRWLIGLCIPFRMISMNSAFLERLRGHADPRAGWYRGSLTAGLAIVGPAAAAAVSASLGTTPGFIIVALLFGLMAVFSLSFLPKREDSATAANAGFVSEIGRLLRDPVTSESCLVEFLGAATSALFTTFIILLALGLPPLTEQEGIRLMLIQGATAVAMLFLGGGIAVRLGRSGAYGLGLLIAVAALLALGLSTTFAGLAIGAVLLSIAAALVHLVNVRMLASTPGAKSKVAGLYNLASMTGSTSGAIGGGLISKLVAIQSIFLAWIPLLAIGAAAIALLHRGRAPSLSTLGASS